MKKSIFLLFVSLECITGTQWICAQAPDWSRLLQISTYGPQTGNVLASDANNLYMAGTLSGPVTWDGVNYTSIGNNDMVLSKVSNNGTSGWTKQFNAQANGSISPRTIQVDAGQNVYVSGAFTGTLTVGSNTLTSGVSYNAFAAKFDANGNGVWATAYLAIGSGTCKMVVDGSGNSYLISNSSKLLKFNSSGVKQWEQTYPNKTLQAIAVNGSNLFVGGMLQGTTTFGSIILNPSNNVYNTGFLVRADLNGTYNNSLVIKGQSMLMNGTSVSDIIMDNTGNLLITGAYTDELILDTVVISNPTAFYCYTYVAKCNANFVFAWAKSSTSISDLNSSQPWTFRLFTDNVNNIYEYGLTSTLFSYGSVAVNPNKGQFLVSFDANGNAKSSVALQNTAYDKILVTPGGKILTTGSYTYNGASSYGNLYLAQYSNNMIVDWQKISTNSQSGTVQVNYVKHDSLGNTYIQARVRGYCNYFGTLLNSDTGKTIISKHDLTGNLLWMNQVTDQSPNLYGTAFALDKDKNVLTTGMFKTSLKIGSILLTSSYSNEGYVAKYSSGGALLWAAKMNLNASVSNALTVATDHDGNVLVSGVITSQKTNYLVKFDPLGNQLWAKYFPIESYFESLVSTDAKNNIYMATEIYLSASNNGSVTIGSLTLTQTVEDGATTLIKFDPNGNALWAKTYGGVAGASYSDGWPVDIKTDANGNSYLWGWCQNHSIFGTNILINPLYNPSGYMGYVTKIDSSGAVVWANGIYEKGFSSNYGDLLDIDKAGNIYAGGHFKDSIKISGALYQPAGMNDFFVTKYSNNGVFQWFKTIPSDGYIINSLGVFDNDILTFAGLAGKNSTLGVFPITKKGGSTSIIPTLGNLPAGIKEINSTSNFSIHPNPSSGKFFIDLKNEKSKMENTEVQISNVLGEKIQTITHWELRPSNEIDVSALSKGVYFVTIHQGDKTSSKKIVIE